LNGNSPAAIGGILANRGVATIARLSAPSGLLQDPNIWARDAPEKALRTFRHEDRHIVGWHLPDDFDERSELVRQEILTWKKNERYLIEYQLWPISGQAKSTSRCHTFSGSSEGKAISSKRRKISGGNCSIKSENSAANIEASPRQSSGPSTVLPH
jgi:hypothetical protein